MFYLFFGCIGSSLLRGLSLVVASGSYASLRCMGFSCCGARAPGMRASVVVACGLSSCGTWVELLHGMWDLPRPGLKPMPPASGFLTTAPPGKSEMTFKYVKTESFKKLQILVTNPILIVYLRNELPVMISKQHGVFRTLRHTGCCVC